MIRPSRLRHAAVALALFAAAVPQYAAAGAPDQQGWWWRVQNGLLVDVPPPPQVPDGGLYVEGAPDGPSAVAALRFPIDAGAVPVALVLRIAAEQGGEQAVMVACPAAEPWIGAAAGRWDARPPAACDDVTIPGKRSDDGTTWTFALGLASFERFVNVVVLPGWDQTRPGGLDGSAFSTAFEPPGPSALVFEDADPGGGLRPPPSMPPSPPPAVPPPGQPSLPDTAVAPGTAPPDVAAPDAPPADAAGPPVSGAAPPEASGAEPAAAAPGSGRDARALATLVALLSVGAAGMLARTPQAPGGPAAGADGERLGGIGRFRRPRSSPPPPL